MKVKQLDKKQALQLLMDNDLKPVEGVVRQGDEDKWKNAELNDVEIGDEPAFPFIVDLEEWIGGACFAQFGIKVPEHEFSEEQLEMVKIMHEGAQQLQCDKGAIHWDKGPILFWAVIDGAGDTIHTFPAQPDTTAQPGDVIEL